MSAVTPESDSVASSAAVENGESVCGFEPKAITAIWSEPFFLRTNERAAAIASASGLPRIDCERSISVEIALVRPRFCSCSPATGRPFSVIAGLTDAPAGETIEARMVG